ncbi:MAG: CHAD domain-containing protein [Chromatiales bacterium]
MSLLAIPEGLEPESVESALRGRFHCEAGSPRRLERRFFDTFDWRLFQAGRVLERERSGRVRRLVLRESGASQPSRVVPGDRVPRFARDLNGADPLRAELAPLLGVRALLPVGRVRSTVRALRVLDGEDKTLVRVLIEEGALDTPDGGSRAPAVAWVRLTPVKGYEDALAQVGQYLERDLGLAPLSEEPMVAAARALGRTPGDYSSKLNYRLEPDQRADAAARLIHLGLLDTLEANVGGTRADLDSEFLHDLRVATRRTRSALTQIKGVFDPKVVERFKDGFAWLGRITGPARDMDVYLLAFDEYRCSLPDEVRGDLNALHEFLLSHQRLEHRRLARRLGSARFRALLAGWRRFLESPSPDHPQAPSAARPVRELADERIWKMYRRVRREGLAIGPDSPPGDLHELRKSCKKLRYLMEFFRSLYDDAGVSELIRILKILLDNLGAFQDYHMQAESLRRFADRMVAEGDAPTATLLAMGMLVGGLIERQRQAREEFAQRFAEFDAKEAREAFRALFAPGAPEGREA